MENWRLLGDWSRKSFEVLLRWLNFNGCWSRSCYWKLLRFISCRLAWKRSSWKVVSSRFHKSCDWACFPLQTCLFSASSNGLKDFSKMQRPKLKTRQENFVVFLFVSNFNWSISVALTIFEWILRQLFSFKRENKFLSTTHCKKFLRSIKVETCPSR